MHDKRDVQKHRETDTWKQIRRNTERERDTKIPRKTERNTEAEIDSREKQRCKETQKPRDRHRERHLTETHEAEIERQTCIQRHRRRQAETGHVQDPAPRVPGLGKRKG